MKTLVLGIGNVLWADEGFGVRCVEALAQRYSFDAEVTLLDGGTQGLYLVDVVGAHQQLLVFDAIDWGDEPGALRVVRDAEVPKFTGAKKMSLHQTGFQDVLSAADLLGRLPSRVTLVGVQAGELEDFGGSLTPRVSAKVEHALNVALDELRAWQVQPRVRTTPVPSMLGPGLDRFSYETGRPSEQVACRQGDERFFAGAAR